MNYWPPEFFYLEKNILDLKGVEYLNGKIVTSSLGIIAICLLFNNPEEEN
jgi:hypothetical protein